MNERIKELAEQANLWRILNSYSWEFGNCDAEKDCGEELEKFAELIILECATLVDAAFDIDEHSGEVVSYADGGQLKEHFGIEE